MFNKLDEIRKNRRDHTNNYVRISIHAHGQRQLKDDYLLLRKGLKNN